MTAVVFQEGDWWVAQVLEFDIAAQAHTREKVITEIQRMVRVRIEACKIEGIDPFDLPPAPKPYHSLADRIVIEPIDSATPGR